MFTKMTSIDTTADSPKTGSTIDIFLFLALETVACLVTGLFFNRRY